MERQKVKKIKFYLYNYYEIDNLGNQIKNLDLILNRIRIDMVKRGDMMSMEDVSEILAIHLLGIIPDDEQVVIGTNQGEPVIELDSMAGKAYYNICRRIIGEEVPFLNLEQNKGMLHRLTHLFKNH